MAVQRSELSRDGLGIVSSTPVLSVFPDIFISPIFSTPLRIKVTLRCGSASRSSDGGHRGTLASKKSSVAVAVGVKRVSATEKIVGRGQLESEVGRFEEIDGIAGKEVATDLFVKKIEEIVDAVVFAGE